MLSCKFEISKETVTANWLPPCKCLEEQCDLVAVGWGDGECHPNAAASAMVWCCHFGGQCSVPACFLFCHCEGMR